MIPPIELPPSETLAALVVLVVDDSAIMRRIIIKNLKSLGVQHIHEAPHAVAAWELLQDTPVDFILCDWNMPGMKGIELLSHVRNHKRLCETPFLMVSAEAQPEYILEAVRKGVSNYLTKPFSQDDFFRKFAAVLYAQQNPPLTPEAQSGTDAASASQ